MPDSVQGIALLLAVLVPGHLLQRGYLQSRAHTVPTRDLRELAESSAVGLAYAPILWNVGGSSISSWIEHQTVRDHVDRTSVVVGFHLVASFILGLLVGKLLDRLARSPSVTLQNALRWTSLYRVPTAWDAAWQPVVSNGSGWAAVRLHLRDGRTIAGLFGDGSHLGLSPAPHEVYFEAQFETAGGQVQLIPRGVFVQAADITTIEFDYIEQSHV